jgi:hypothetical protein
MKISFLPMRIIVATLSVATVSALSVIGWSPSAAQQGAQPPFLPLSISINALMVAMVDDVESMLASQSLATRRRKGRG